MSKRAKSDKNIENALSYALEDIAIFGKNGKKYKVTKSMSERQKNALLRSAEQLINSPYSTVKATRALYKKQRDKFAENYGLTKKQAQRIINMFSSDKQVADAWERIRSDVKYTAIVPHLKDGKLSSIAQNIGVKKYGQLMRLYVEGGFTNELDFASFISDKEYLNFAKNMTLSELTDFVDSKPWE